MLRVSSLLTPWGYTVEWAARSNAPKRRNNLRKGISVVCAALMIAVSVDVMPASAAVPGAPKITSAKSGNGAGNVTLKWSAPASDGGSPITQYVYAYSTNGGTTWSADTYLSTPFIRSVTGPLCHRYLQVACCA